MIAKRTYNTSGKKALVDFLCQNPDRQFTAEELCLAVNQNNMRAISSVYRYLTDLCQAEIVRKFHSEERNCNVYQYVGEHCNCRQHFHIKCLICGKLHHLECSDSAHFTAHLQKEHGFWVDCGQSILYGVCADCRQLRKEPKKHGALA